MNQEFLKILINSLIIIGLMSVFIFFFYFYFIVNIETTKLTYILKTNIFNKIHPITINNVFIQEAIKNNKYVRKKAYIFLSIGIIPLIFGLYLIYINNLSFKSILSLSFYILLISILTEFIFALTFIKYINVMNDSDFINSIPYGINDYDEKICSSVIN